MGEISISKKINVEKLMSYSDDLVYFLNYEKDINQLIHTVNDCNDLRSRCRLNLDITTSSLQEYQKQIEICQQKTEAAKAEVASDSEIGSLQEELDDELQRETSLQEELRAITSFFKDQEEQRRSIEDRIQALKKLEHDDNKTQMKLSLYASITRIIPDLSNQFKISGDIVDKEKNVVEKFAHDFNDTSDFDTCNTIWKKINH
ncbi:kinetochore protein SPC24 homolog [Rutidosis leptorrhynchoides]|uniref:kinetochore protein SPC24 homolog n=1 Tax=Rutidosis leptorrhynchoides TaxID=125765 RepID=UPI003A9973BB